MSFWYPSTVAHVIISASSYTGPQWHCWEAKVLQLLPFGKPHIYLQVSAIAHLCDCPFRALGAHGDGWISEEVTGQLIPFPQISQHFGLT